MLFILLIALAVPLLRADRITPAKPLFTEVHLRANGPREEKVTGNLVSYDDTTLTVAIGKTQRELKWIELTPISAFTLRSRLIDKTKAGDWLELAQFGWSIGATEQTRTAIDNALRLDPTLKPQTDQITATPPGSAVTASVAPSGGNELIGPDGTTKNAPTRGTPLRPDDGTTATPTEMFKAATPDESDAAIARAKKMAADVQNKFAVKFETLSTAHFLIFTDWDPQEYDFLKTNFEDAYSAVSSQFNIPAKENVFVGKLPVLMFAKFKDYARLTDSIGFLGKPVDRNIRGYYQGASDGSGRMVMYKPTAEERQEAEREWAHVLVHEFTHAFVARYHTNARMPRWLDEGLAEVTAAQNFPRAGTYPFAKRMAAEHQSAGTLFDDNIMPTGEWYPVMQTMVEYLIAQDRNGFLQMFDAIKAGMKGEDALQKFYNLNDNSLMKSWRQAMLKSNA